MIKRLIYILLFLPLACIGQYNFFTSNPAVELFHLYTDSLEYTSTDINYDIYILDKPHAWAGTRLYILGGASRSSVYQYTTSPDYYKMSSATYSAIYNFATQDNSPVGISFKGDGKKMYMIGTENDRVYQYSLSSDWVVSTASYDSKYLDFSSTETAPTDLFFKPDGSGLYILGQQMDSVIYYSLLTDWDVSTANMEEGYYVGNVDANPKDIFFSDDGYKMYITGSYTDTIYRYTLSDAWTLPAVWNEAIATQDKSFAIGESYGPLNGTFIKQDWNKLYITGSGCVHTFWLNELKVE